MKEMPSVRMKKILNVLSISPSHFADEMGYSRAYISDLLNKGGNPRKHFYNLLYLLYNINESWARTGRGDIFCHNTNTQVNKVMIKLRSLSDEDLKFIERIVDSLLGR